MIVWSLRLRKIQRTRAALPRRIKPGSVLVRDWKGNSHRVTVLDHGFAYHGKTYASLSEIARPITGTRWNGPRFFGLRGDKAASAWRDKAQKRNCAARSTPANRPSMGWSLSSIRSMPSARPARPISNRKPTRAGRRCQRAMTIRPIPAAISIALPCRNCLADIEAGHVDVVVVYKIDRLTRSLADFAKLVEAFDAKSVSFVAVTQQFNTTTSMGRLTLNVLLSFAQFERELSSERVRDKVAASRKKGKWTGGSVPLGYDVKDKKLVVNPAEAETVRTIFRRYLALKCLRRLKADLDEKGIVSKQRATHRSQSRRSSVHLWPPRLSAQKPHLSWRNGSQGPLVRRRT